jgi:hypothetical protein
VSGLRITQLPRWVLNTLRARPDYVATWPEAIRVNGHDFNDGYEIVTLELWSGRSMQMRRVTGRNYSDRAVMCCFECSRTTKELAAVDPLKQFLRACACPECRVLLCVDCRSNHETLHELGGEPIVNPWSRAEVAEYKWREEKK